jgi:hypothetical protein
MAGTRSKVNENDYPFKVNRYAGKPASIAAITFVRLFN